MGCFFWTFFYAILLNKEKLIRTNFHAICSNDYSTLISQKIIFLNNVDKKLEKL